MLQGEHSAILLTCIKLPFSITTFVSSIFKWPLKTGFTVYGENVNLHWKSSKFTLALHSDALVNTSGRVLFSSPDVC